MSKSQVVSMFDTIGADAGSLIGNRQVRKVAYYLTGSGGVAWSSADLERLRRAGVQLVPIDQTDGTFPFLQYRTLVKDCEPGASTNRSAVAQVEQRRRHGLKTTLYTMVSNWEALTSECIAAGVLSSVEWGIADWNLDRAGAEQFLLDHAHAGVVWVQWASPSSNPGTILPGSGRTLAQANVDLSVTLESWGVRPAPKREFKPKRAVKKVVHKARKPVRPLSPAGHAAVLAVFTAWLELAHVLGVNFPK